MAKSNMVVVRCQAAAGFDGCFRAGRKWAAAGEEVELIDQDDDRPTGDGKPFGVGKKTLAALRADHRFAINADGALDELVSLRKRVAELEGQLAEATKGGKAKSAKE